MYACKKEVGAADSEVACKNAYVFKERPNAIDIEKKHAEMITLPNVSKAMYPDRPI